MSQIYSIQIATKAKNIVELETFRLTHLEYDYLIVIEGKKAQDLLQSFEKE
ncbi:hypothetical protein [Bacillus sp. NPDC093026]|uniref:hypothetical protein n=1 Tax=Bacillus sp. NPDC093026 TaxID=3363948 RepID=UPI0037FC540F